MALRSRTLLSATALAVTLLCVPAGEAGAVPRTDHDMCPGDGPSSTFYEPAYYLNCSATYSRTSFGSIVFEGDFSPGEPLPPPACPPGSHVIGSTNFGRQWPTGVYLHPSPVNRWNVGYISTSGWITWEALDAVNPFVWSDDARGVVSLRSSFLHWYLFGSASAQMYYWCHSPALGARAGRLGAEGDPPEEPDPGDPSEEEPDPEDFFDETGTEGADDLDAPPGDDPWDLSGGEGDDELTGADGDDELAGGPGDDETDGGEGDDLIGGGEGDDVSEGDEGDDQLWDGPGDDHAFGGEGDDTVLTGEGDDTGTGGKGHDRLFDNRGRDKLSGGPGDDVFSSFDKRRDLIVCGRGEDIVVADRRDRVDRSCEHVFRRKRGAPKRPPRTRNHGGAGEMQTPSGVQL